MGRKSIERLGRLQREVLEVVWDAGEANVRDVIDRLSRGKKPAYTTILTVMQNLESAGWLKHRQEGRTYIYRPTVSRDELAWNAIRRSVRSLFKGDVGAFVQHLIKEEELSGEDLAELRRMIDRRRKEKRHD